MKKLMLGNEAVARGAYEAGVRVVSSYPGTPSTEITEFCAAYPEIDCEWAPNEKVAVETAFGAAMTAYDLLSNPNGFPVLAGQWCSHDSFNAVQAGTLQGQLKASVTPPAAQHFSGRIDRLRQAVARLGGTPTDGPGDFSAVLPVLPFFPVLLRFWEQDDEFPAQLQFLWDRNSMRYLTYETSFYTHRAILDRLLEADM